MKGTKTVWTLEMENKLKSEFPYRITIDIGKEMNLSIRTLIRKAREFGIEKEENFLDKNRTEISKRAKENLPENPNKGNKDFRIAGGEKFQFVKGQEMHKIDYLKVHRNRNETIRKEKLRLKYGLPQKTKLKLTNIY